MIASAITIGIVTLNVNQRDLILDLLDEEASNDKEFGVLYNLEKIRNMVKENDVEDKVEILGLQNNKVSMAEIKSAYREQAKKYHPDVNIQNTRNEDIELTITPVPGTNWIVGLSIPTSQIQELPNTINKSSRILFLIILVSILFFISAEIYISNLFFKHQRVTTPIDPLTKLWTREKFEREAKRIMKFHPNSKFMLIESDIRGFKFINQNYGELVADKIIIQFSRVLNKHIQSVNGIMGRGFADHFYSFVKISSVQQAMRVFQKNVDEVNAKIKNLDVPFIPKFGISFVLPDGKNKNVTIQALIGQASFAKSTIKDNMIKQYSIYNSRLLNKTNKEQYIENNMEQALENEEFFVMYQPKIDLATDKIVGAEALVRWIHPKKGLVNPTKFIPLFEKTGFSPVFISRKHPVPYVFFASPAEKQHCPNSAAC